MSEEARLALLAFLTQRYDELKRRLARHLGSGELAGDALQDTWLRLERLENQAPVLNPRAFLLRMAANIAIDQQRSHSRALPADEAEALMDLPDHAPGPEKTAEDRSEVEQLMKAMRRLPERRRAILVLVRWENLPHKEVAERLGISVRTVEHELRKAHEFCAAATGRPKK
ncbi:sigma-70 family RNA polymerase sigma factor [Xylophilus rhododendri]|uniref:Sigma-70 family RNA polymerase sigma factor n=1 Tax=Xylophilus rhododendri TaxID=2697032 RepID=A0A857J3F9_9BURK|nr:sigma-70 family RNA polymerase sigma factor [Xylophilus rhododendri]QHI97395.1 sigma-70 family RNA polymerase sigma factor [Xylophilus rhododendri]